MVILMLMITITKANSLKTFNPSIDFHCHILPCVDDGAKTLEESISILNEEIKQGVNTVVMTPHFYVTKNSFEEFISKRQEAYSSLLYAKNVNNLKVDLLLGCEVMFSPEILNIDLTKLCIQDTNYILIEFPHNHYPMIAKNVFFALQNQGFTPIIAHAERYENLSNDDLREMIYSGILIQVNTSSLFDNRKYSKRVMNLIDNNMVHLFGTDTHSIDKRPPTFLKAKNLLEKKYGNTFFTKYQSFSIDVLNNLYVNVPDPKKIKKSLFSIFH